MDNYFIALKPSEAIIEKITGLTAGLTEKYPGIKWVDAGLYHITLKFLGRVGEDKTRIEFESFEFSEKIFECSGLGFFYYNNRNRRQEKEGWKPRVLFLEYQSERGRKYHLTLARIKRDYDASILIYDAGALNERMKNELKQASFTSDNIFLMHSRFDKKLIYEILDEKPIP